MQLLSQHELARRNRQRVAALSEQDAARYLGMSYSWLRHARLQQSEHAPPHIRLGKAVRYRIADLDGFLEERRA